jgi:hypothetical protein
VAALRLGHFEVLEESWGKGQRNFDLSGWVVVGKMFQQGHNLVERLNTGDEAVGGTRLPFTALRSGRWRCVRRQGSYQGDHGQKARQAPAPKTFEACFVAWVQMCSMGLGYPWGNDLVR